MNDINILNDRRYVELIDFVYSIESEGFDILNFKIDKTAQFCPIRDILEPIPPVRIIYGKKTEKISFLIFVKYDKKLKKYIRKLE